MQDLPDAADTMESIVHQLRLALGQTDRRAAWSEVAADRSLQVVLLDLSVCLQRLKDWLELAAERGRGLESCRQRAAVMNDRLTLLLEHSSTDYIHWFETFRTSFRLNLTPLNVAPYFRSCVDSLSSAWVFTSATLAVGDGFEHFSGQLGLDDARMLKLDSPFDYQRNALLYMPEDMPAPNDRFYVDAVVACARDILQASKGRAFMLFTSHVALQSAARQLQDTLPYPLLVQGTAPRRELLERFRELGNAVLLGTSSFWEGVDVRGAALSCVIIDKLPFGSPGEPVLQARIEAMREQGENPFMQYQLPRAVINLKQGVGRLIRDKNDRGVLVLCDPRLRSKAYGKVFLKSLPEMPQTSSPDTVAEFFADAGATPVEPVAL
jgi:ATP-dependent DNA helicase DinG